MNAKRNPAGRRGEGRQAKPAERRVLVVDVGGTNVKVYLSGTAEVHKIPSERKMTAEGMTSAVLKLARTWEYDGGRMLFLGLGTGLGTALVWDGVLEPMELAHLHYRKGRTFEEYLGMGGFVRRGEKKWCESVADVVTRLKEAFGVDEVVLGGGEAKRFKEAPPGARLGDNANAFLGGLSLWKRVVR
jgi:predicted NBD/HSP70 family sugar kinase